jgi:putative endonuclease
MAARAYLTAQGYKILEKNYRVPIGEIDAVCEKAGRIVFVEVKTRSGERFGAPEESVHAFKQRKLLRLAEWYLKDKRLGDVSVSFAVVAVVMGPGTPVPKIRLIENAFGA